MKQPVASKVGRREILARPVKRFFIETLTKDIPLERAIIDLVDNSVDGAIKLRGPSGPYDGLWVRIEAGLEGVRIADNCGGIDVETAASYAFRFGREEGFPGVDHSVGQFGVGMKRALFKLGKQFEVESKSASAEFTIRVNVNKWLQSPDWTFEFETLNEGLDIPFERRGTTISVSVLREEIAERFGLENFLNGLGGQIRAAHRERIGEGLAITLNQIPLDVDPLVLLRSPDMAPAFVTRSYGEGRSKVEVRLFAGLGEPGKPDQAGWYLYCNGRLILGPDSSDLTGWGTNLAKRIPSFHPQFARFRGFAFFDSDDPLHLPWNTTKTGVDADSKIYRAVLLEMVLLARPVVDFLNKLKEERQAAAGEPGPLDSSLAGAEPTVLTKIEPSESFVPPPVELAPPGPSMGRISYSRPVDQIRRIKEVLGVGRNNEVGEKTFDYFYGLEVEE